MCKQQLVAIVAIIVTICLTGCSPEDSTYFDHTISDVNTAWWKAVQYDKENEYLSAAEVYDHMLHMELTSDQRTQVQNTILRMYGRMKSSAANGNGEAQRVLAMLDANNKMHN